MKLHTTETKLEREGVNTESTFTIKTTAKAFDILSSGLYSDKILAVIRELSANAKDAHVQAGRGDVPFEVHIPTVMEPFFSVKDYGVSMTDEQIMTLYTTYFDSTKTESNDFIGALGLGSKSPFSYTKSFTVTACKDGVKRVYTMFINEHGVPSVAKTFESDFDESIQDGLEVKIAVLREDFHRFSDRAESALQYYNPLPLMTGGSIYLKEPNYKMEGNGWAILDKNSWHKEYIAIQGNVPYPLDIYQIRDKMSDKAKRIIEEMSLVMHFEIGELEVAANREALQYDDRTIRNIEKRFEQIADDVQALIESKITTQKTRWDFYLMMNKLSLEMFRSESKISELFRTSSCSSASSQNNIVPISTNKRFNDYVNNRRSFNFRTSGGLEFPNISLYVYADDRSKRAEMHMSVSPHARYIVLENDMKVGGVRRIQHYLSKNDKQALTIRCKNLDGSDQKEMKKFIRAIGSPKVVKVSTLPKPPMEPKKGTRVDSIYVLEDRSYGSYGYKRRAVWNRLILDSDRLANGGVYLEKDGRTFLGNDDKHYDPQAQLVGNENLLFRVLEQHYPDLVDLELPRFIFGATKNVVKKLKNEPNWFDLMDIVKPLVDGLHKRFLAQENYHHVIAEFRPLRLIEKSAVRQRILDTLNPGLLRDTFESTGKMYDTNNVDDVWNLKYTLEALGFRFDLDPKSLITEQEIEERYPMLKFVDSYQFECNFDTIATYINLIDKVEETNDAKHD